MLIRMLTLICAPVIAALLSLVGETPPSQEPPKPRRIDIEVTVKGFTPASVTVEPGLPIDLVFTRRTDQTCATEVVVPSLKTRKPLPLNEAVPIRLTPEKDDIAFACGMNMLKGSLVVK